MDFLRRKRTSSHDGPTVVRTVLTMLIITSPLSRLAIENGVYLSAISQSLGFAESWPLPASSAAAAVAADAVAAAATSVSEADSHGVDRARRGAIWRRAAVSTINNADGPPSVRRSVRLAAVSRY